MRWQCQAGADNNVVFGRRTHVAGLVVMIEDCLMVEATEEGYGLTERGCGGSEREAGSVLLNGRSMIVLDSMMSRGSTEWQPSSDSGIH